MKNLTILLLILVAKNAFSSVDTMQVKSEIKDVTVFFSGAQVTRQAELKLRKGQHLLIADKLPREINPQSIQISAMKDCKILSVKHQLNHENENRKGDEELDMESKIEAQEMKIKELKNKFSVFDVEEQLLMDNSLLSKKDEGASISKIKEAADFYRVRINEIRQGKLLLSAELKAANKKIQELYTGLNEVTAQKRKTYSRVLIVLECEKELTVGLRFSYYISSAGWEPLYDFRVDDIQKPFIIVYNANVYQSSGEGWNNVNMKLSTNNPSLSGDKPGLVTWYLGRKNPYQQESLKKGVGGITGRVMDKESNEGLAYAIVTISSGNDVIAGTQTDQDGQFTIKPVASGTYTVKVAYVGYDATEMKSMTLDAGKIASQDFKLQPNKLQLEAVEVAAYKVPLIDRSSTSSTSTYTLDEIRHAPMRDLNAIASVAGAPSNSPANIRSSRAYSSVYEIEGENISGVETTNYISNSLKSTVANMEYTIEIPYTIPSDGQDYSIKIKEVSTPVNYEYHTVPKLDKDAFLTAEISNWTQLNLLSGKSSIYFRGTFTGQSYIDADQSSDTLSVSLGRDKDIIVSREGNKQMYDKRIAGGNIKETIGWDITLKNNKDVKVKIVVEDQYPVSERKSIDVERQEASGGKLDEKSGKLTWEVMLEPNEKKVVNYKYSVKYSRDLSLHIE